MGFGLHQGWAIEGSIGSYFKIDASYLSPNVNMAARLEAATKQFGADILISGDLHDILSDEFQKICREIDTVTVKGSIRPVRLFTVDVFVEDMIATQDPLTSKSMKERKSIRDKTRKVFFQRLYSGQSTTWKELTQDFELIELRRKHDKNFDELFARAYRAYLEGNWAVAGKSLK